MTVNEILQQFYTLKARINEYYQLIYNEVNADVTLDDLTSQSKTAEYNLWMWINSAMAVILDGVWADRQKQISDKVDSGAAGTDPWFQLESLKFQYGDALQWDAQKGKYFYAVLDIAKQIIKRCAVVSASGITAIKVATEDGSGNPIALTSDELTAFRAYINQIQWAGSKILPPTSAASDKLNAPMTVYYDGTIQLDTIKTIVQDAWINYLKTLPFNGQYSINKHGDFVESSSVNIREVNMGAVQARGDSGSFTSVTRVYSPVSGYLDKDAAIDWDVMITYSPQ